MLTSGSVIRCKYCTTSSTIGRCRYQHAARPNQRVLHYFCRCCGQALAIKHSDGRYQVLDQAELEYKWSPQRLYAEGTEVRNRISEVRN